MGDFLARAIGIVKEAAAADREERYEEALQKYQLALEYFMTAFKCVYLFSLLGDIPD